ncbi:MAG: hypothetical protein ABFD50_08030 [Smithella sp.]
MDFENVDRNIQKLKDNSDGLPMEFYGSILDAIDSLVTHHGYVPSVENMVYLAQLNESFIDAIKLENCFEKPAYEKERC